MLSRYNPKSDTHTHTHKYHTYRLGDILVCPERTETPGPVRVGHPHSSLRVNVLTSTAIDQNGLKCGLGGNGSGERRRSIPGRKRGWQRRSERHLDPRQFGTIYLGHILEQLDGQVGIRHHDGHSALQRHLVLVAAHDKQIEISHKYIFHLYVKEASPRPGKAVTSVCKD
jgi:hypothetical protein